MSMITPMGSKPTWDSSEKDKMSKTASTKGQKAVEENDLYTAAKRFLEAQAKEENGWCKDCQCDPCECKIEKESVTGFSANTRFDDDEESVVEVDEKDEGIEEVAQSVSEAVKEVENKAEEAEAVVEQVEEAIEKIEEAVQGVRDVCSSDEVEVEVDVDVEDEGEEEFSIEVSESDEIEDGDDIIIESEPDSEARMASSKTASSSDDFVKLSKLSNENRKKIKNYWVNSLNYPKDYVDLMVKDYE